MKITPEIVEQINILYLKLGTKAAVARQIGCSPATVSKYISPSFKLPEEKTTYTFDGTIGNANKLSTILSITPLPAREVCRLCLLSEEEWREIKEIQKEIFV